jgi:hypothetical protein
MLFCEKKIFNKFLFFSMIFLCFSFFFNGVIVASTQVDATEQPKNITKTTSDCMTQQRQIISSLEKIEYNLSARKLEKK